MSKKDLCAVFVSAYDVTRLRKFCEELAEAIPNSAYHIQYMVRNIPLKSIIKNTKKNHPELELIIIGNTNNKFGTVEDYDYITKKANEPFFETGIVDLRVAEETGTGKILKETVSEAFNVTKELTERNIEKLRENI